MTIYPVQHSALLRQTSHPFSREVLEQTVQQLIENLVHIRDNEGEFLLHLDDGRTIDTKSWLGWEWTHGIGLYGMYQYYRQTADEKVLMQIDHWFEHQFSQESVTKNVNTVCPFLTLAYRYQETQSPIYRSYLECWADYVMHQMPRTQGGALQHITYTDEHAQQLWDDTLMMSALPLAKMGQVLQRPDYIEEAKYQFLIHAQYLMDAETGLWFHGWNFEGHHHFAKARWARGNSWITIAIPELLELLDLSHQDPFFRHLQQLLQQQVRTLIHCQDPSGLWHTLLDDPDSYLETSATAGFAYGILKAVRKNYLDREYAGPARRAVEALVSRYINPEGELLNVSFGTAMGNDLDYYRNIPLTSMPYGQAMAILCLSEYRYTYL
ncbi:glycoside hydrolase family 105 protein [Celerinatantimonas sp. YJH-8]|uniref:beta-galactosidase BglB n=1 Tax=Celerinatantimonas sp. YJH-8 TaxID=3228714 RepID=UPI0038C59CC4